jgi:hypothetical protein
LGGFDAFGDPTEQKSGLPVLATVTALLSPTPGPGFGFVPHHMTEPAGATLFAAQA